jgi:hypothetical protein
MVSGTSEVWIFGVGEARRLLTRIEGASEFLAVGDGSSKYAGLEKSVDVRLHSVLEYILSEVKKKIRLCPKDEMMKSTLSVVLGLQELLGGIRAVITMDASNGWFCR